MSGPLEELRALSEAASEGEWWVGDPLSPEDDAAEAVLVDYGNNTEVALTTPGTGSYGNGTEPERWHADAALAAASVNYVRALLAASGTGERRTWHCGSEGRAHPCTPTTRCSGGLCDWTSGPSIATPPDAGTGTPSDDGRDRWPSPGTCPGCGEPPHAGFCDPSTPGWRAAHGLDVRGVGAAIEVRQTPNYFSPPGWDHHGVCRCGASLPPMDRWLDRDLQWSWVRCEGCGWTFVDEGDHIAAHAPADVMPPAALSEHAPTPAAPSGTTGATTGDKS